MTKDQVLIARNVVNGVEVEALARSLHLDVARVNEAFTDAMRKVAEYVLVHCVPFFPCRNVAEARANRSLVISVLESIELWDDIQRDIMLDLLQGVNVIKKYEVARPAVEVMLSRTLAAVPHYLAATEAGSYGLDRRAFLRDRRKRVIEAVERFVSFKNPLVYKHIEHQNLTLEG